MTKILIEDDENGNRMKVLEPSDGARMVDILTTIGSPLMSIVVDVCDHDRKKEIKMLTGLLDAYIETNGDEADLQ